MFLWVRLAIRSVIDGIRDGDSWGIISKRTQELDPDLDKLFQQMWERQNADRVRCKEDTEDTAILLWYALHVYDGRLGKELRSLLGFILGTHMNLRSDLLHFTAEITTTTEEMRVFQKYEKWL